MKRKVGKMKTENLVRQFQEAGYKRAIVNGAYVDVLLQIRPQCTHVVVLIDCIHLRDLTVEKYEGIVRAIRKSIYNYDFQQVQMLQVLCTNEPEQEKEYLSVFGEHWIVDLEEERLLIYENQIAEFSNAREIIEQAFFRAEMIEQERIKDRRNYIKENICTILLVILNILVFIWIEVTGSSLDVEHIANSGGLCTKSVGHGFWYYQLITSMFLHFGMEHLAGNMFMLLALGQYVEKRVGKIFYLTIYFGAGLIGNLAEIFDMLQNQGQVVVAAGASGAVYGIVGALLYLVIQNHGRLEELPFRNIILLTIFGICNVMISPNVNYAHVGGLIGGFILTGILCLLMGKEEKDS